MREGIKYLNCAACAELQQEQDLSIALNADDTRLLVMCDNHAPSLAVGLFEVKLSPQQAEVAKTCHHCGEPFTDTPHVH